MLSQKVVINLEIKFYKRVDKPVLFLYNLFNGGERLENMLQTILEEVKSVKVELRAEMQDMKQELRTEMQEMKQELRGEMQGMKQELRGEIQDVKTEILEVMDQKLEETKTEILDVMDQKLEKTKTELREEIDSKTNQQSKEIAEELQQIVIMQERRDDKFQRTVTEILKDIRKIKTQNKEHEYRISKLEDKQEELEEKIQKVG